MSVQAGRFRPLDLPRGSVTNLKALFHWVRRLGNEHDPAWHRARRPAPPEHWSTSMANVLFISSGHGRYFEGAAGGLPVHGLRSFRSGKAGLAATYAPRPSASLNVPFARAPRAWRRAARAAR